MNPAPQAQQDDWYFQWEHYQDDSLWLFQEWIHPHTLETFRDKDVVDCGCGGGQHIEFVAPYAHSVVGIDLNTVELAKKRNEQTPHVAFVEGDLANLKLERTFDIAYCIGVIQHTVNPDATFANIKQFVKPGGLLILWCYSKEGNWPNWLILEPLKRLIILKLPKSILQLLATVLTFILYPIVYSIYILPLRFLPYYQYFENWRKLSFVRNRLNVFDKLNAPITNFITHKQVDRWFNQEEFTDVHMDHYKKVSWRASGIRK